MPASSRVRTPFGYLSGWMFGAGTRQAFRGRFWRFDPSGRLVHGIGVGHRAAWLPDPVSKACKGGVGRIALEEMISILLSVAAGIALPSGRTVSIHSWTTVSALVRASARVAPSAAPPGNPGYFAMKTLSSALQEGLVTCFVILRLFASLRPSRSAWRAGLGSPGAGHSPEGIPARERYHRDSVPSAALGRTGAIRWLPGHREPLASATRREFLVCFARPSPRHGAGDR